MPRNIIVYDDKGKAAEMQPADAQMALSQGSHWIPKGQRVRIVTSSGEAVSVPSEDLQEELVKYGSRLESPEETETRDTRKSHGSGFADEATAGILGAMRGLSFGGSDWLLSEVGLGDDVRKFKQANPDASMAGEVGSVVGGVLMPGAALGKLGQAITAPVKGAAKVGLGVEKAVTGAATRALGSAGERFAGKALSKAAGMGAGSAVEGALYGAGQFVSEASLGETDATAENLLGHVGMGAALGGGFGAGLGAGFTAVKAAGKMTAKGAQSVVDMVASQTGMKPLDGLADAYRKTAGVVSGAGDELSPFFGKGAAEARRLSTITDDEVGKAAFDLSGKFDSLRDVQSRFIDSARGKMKKKFMVSAGKEADRSVATKSVTDLMGTGSADDSLAGLAGDMHNATVDRAAPAFGKAQAHLVDLNKAIKTANNDIKDILTKSGDDAPGELFIRMDEIKRKIGRTNESLENSFRRNGDPQVLKAIEFLDDRYQSIKSLLEQDSVWGRTAATAQMEVNKHWVPVMRRIRHNSKYKFDRIIGREDFGVAHTGKTSMRQTDPGEVERFLSDLGTNKVRLDQEWVTQQIRAKEDLLSAIGKHYDIPSGSGELAKAQGLRKSIEATIGDMEKKIGLRNQLKAIEGVSRVSGLDVGTAATAGFLVGGVPGALVGGALGAVMNPARTIRQLATLDRVSKGYRLKVSTAVKSYTKKAGSKKPSKLKRVIAPTSVGILGRASFGEKNPPKKENRVQSYNRIMRELSAVVSNPERSEQVSKGMAEVEKVAPKIVAAMNQKTIEAAGYILAKAPKSPLAGNIGSSVKWAPAQSELSKFERVVQAVLKPDSVLKDLQQGTISKEAVDAIREVWPQQYEHMVTELADNLADLQTLPYQERTKLDLMFPEILIDQTTRPDFMAAMQAGIMRPVPQQQQRRPAARQANRYGDNINMTSAQRLESKA